MTTHTGPAMTTPTTTQELIADLEAHACAMEEAYGPHEQTAKNFRAAASRLSELQDEVVRLREALADLTSWFTDLPLVHNVWIIPAGERGADGAVNAARAALDQQGDRG